MKVIKNCSESEAIDELRKTKDQKVKIYKRSIYVISSGNQFDAELKYLSEANNLDIKVYMDKGE